MKNWTEKKVEAVTAEELNQIQTAQGLRERIYQSDNRLVRHIRQQAFHQAISEEHTLLLTAYHALVQVERFEQEAMDRAMVTPNRKQLYYTVRASTPGTMHLLTDPVRQGKEVKQLSQPCEGKR